MSGSKVNLFRTKSNSLVKYASTTLLKQNKLISKNQTLKQMFLNDTQQNFIGYLCENT